MRDVELMRDIAGVMNVLSGTARTFAVHGIAMIVELQGNADDIITLLFEKGGDQRRVDAARHGHDYAQLAGRAVKMEIPDQGCDARLVVHISALTKTSRQRQNSRAIAHFEGSNAKALNSNGAR